MKIIFDNIIFDLQKKGGISNYWGKLYSNVKKDYKVLSYNYKYSKNLIPISIYRYLDFSIKASHKFIFHSSYYRISKNKKAINIVTVHDFVYEYYNKGLRKLVHKIQKGRAIKNAEKIICVSQNTKNDLLKLYPNIEKGKVHVVYHGVSDNFKPLKKKTTNSNKIIFVGNREGYKNFNVLIKAFLKLKKFELILVGGGSLKIKEAKLLKDINYRHYMNITEKKLNELYNESFVMVYPSLYEGFGLPILESLKAGCPVICSNKSSTGEIGKNYVLSGEISSSFIIDSIEKLKDEKFRGSLISSGILYASKYKWKNTAKETIKIYKEAWQKFQS